MTKAAVLLELGGDFEIWDVELAAPRAGEVTVRLAASGICHSDFSMRSGQLPFVQNFPAVLGHEGSGVIEEVGPGVTSVKPGDHVVMSFKAFCGHCWYCSRGEGYLCTYDMDKAIAGAASGDTAPPWLTAAGQPVFPNGTATFTERTVVSEHHVVKIPDDASLSAAALLGCGVMTGFGAAVNTAQIHQGDTVAVIGCGGVGLSTIQGAKHAGAEEIIAVDVVDAKLTLGASVGATHGVNSANVDAVEAVRELTGGRGADHVFEVIGLQQTIASAVQMTRPGGATILVGLPSPTVGIDANAVSLILDNRSILGSMYGSCDFGRDVNRLLDLYEQGSLKLDELISRRIPLEQIQDGFDAMATGQDARSVIEF